MDKYRVLIGLWLINIALIANILLSTWAVAGSSLGSQSDPLVTKSYVDQLIKQKTAALSAQISETKKTFENSVWLWVDQKKAKIGPKVVQIDVAPTKIKDRVYVPIRLIGEAIGAKIEWDNQTKTVTYTKAAKVITLTVGSLDAKIGQTSQKLDAAPISVNNRVLVPVRVVSESLGAKVNWFGKTQLVEVIY